MGKHFKTLIMTFLVSFFLQSQAFTAMADQKATISDVEIRFDGHERTQVIIYASHNIDYSEAATFSGAMRYWLDFERLVWALPGGTDSKGVGPGGGHIQYFRYAHHKPDPGKGSDIVSRLVFVLDQPVYVHTSFSLPPDSKDKRWKIVLIFQKTDEATFKKLKPINQTGEGGNIRLGIDRGDTGAKVIKINDEKADKVPHMPIIVIDPGHGGADPGAIGGKNFYEKDVVLKASLKLRDVLKASGKYKVIMTRQTDVLVDHEERIRIAREASADLFISIHADSAGNDGVKGASVYTLSEKGDARLESFLKDGDWNMPVEIHADGENGAPDSDVEDILLSLLTRETLGHSAEFAKLLIPELAKAGPVLRNSHRQANFYVLLSPNVPAVLLELGFLTNSEDVNRLSRGDGVDKSVAAVKAAIDKYFETHKPASAI